MMGKEDIDDIKGIKISRLPKKTREEFKQFAKEEFADDFGMALNELWNKYKEWAIIYQNFDIKLNHIITLLENRNEERPQEKKEIRTLAGRIGMKGGSKKDGK